MAGEVFTTRYWSRHAGVNNTLPDESIADDEFSDLANYQPDRSGNGWLIKREGITRESSNVTAQVYSVFNGRNANYFHAGTVIRNFAGTSLDTGRAAAADTWTSFGTYDIFVNGTDARKTSDGAAFSAVSNIPSGTKYIAAVNNFLYGAGHDKGKLRWANIGTAETWPTTNELVLTQDENDDIVIIAPTTNALLVLCSKSHQMVTGFSNLEQEVSYYSKVEGCTASRSVAVTPFGVFWFSKAGVVWLKDGYQLDYPMLRKLSTTLGALNRGQDANIHAVWDSSQNRVMFFLFNGAAQTTVNLRADFYPEFDAWYLHTGAGVQMAASGSALVSGVSNVYVGGYAASTYLYKVSGNDDDTVAISAFAETKREAYGSSQMLKKCRKVVLTTNYGTTATTTYAQYIDNATATDTTWTHTSLGTGRVDTVMGCNRLHYKLKHRVADAAATRTKIWGLHHEGYVVRGR